MYKYIKKNKNNFNFIFKKFVLFLNLYLKKIFIDLIYLFIKKENLN